jgi:hypothetical protein
VAEHWKNIIEKKNSDILNGNVNGSIELWLPTILSRYVNDNGQLPLAITLQEITNVFGRVGVDVLESSQGLFFDFAHVDIEGIQLPDGTREGKSPYPDGIYRYTETTPDSRCVGVKFTNLRNGNGTVVIFYVDLYYEGNPRSTSVRYTAYAMCHQPSGNKDSNRLMSEVTLLRNSICTLNGPISIWGCPGIYDRKEEKGYLLPPQELVLDNQRIRCWRGNCKGKIHTQRTVLVLPVMVARQAMKICNVHASFKTVYALFLHAVAPTQADMSKFQFTPPRDRYGGLETTQGKFEEIDDKASCIDYSISVGVSIGSHSVTNYNRPLRDEDVEKDHRITLIRSVSHSQMEPSTPRHVAAELLDMPTFFIREESCKAGAKILKKYTNISVNFNALLCSSLLEENRQAGVATIICGDMNMLPYTGANQRDRGTVVSWARYRRKDNTDTKIKERETAYGAKYDSAQDQWMNSVRLSELVLRSQLRRGVRQAAAEIQGLSQELHDEVGCEQDAEACSYD